MAGRGVGPMFAGFPGAAPPHPAAGVVGAYTLDSLIRGYSQRVMKEVNDATVPGVTIPIIIIARSMISHATRKDLQVMI